MTRLLLLAFVVLANLASAQSSTVTVGFALAADLIPSAVFTSHADIPAPDVFVRAPLIPELSAELRAGYRGYSYSEYHGATASSYVLRQYPVTLGLTYAFLGTSSVQPFLSMGAGVSFSSWSYSSYRYPGPARKGSGTRAVFTSFAGIGFMRSIGGHGAIEVGALYFVNPLASDTGEPSSQNYVRLRVGVGYRF